MKILQTIVFSALLTSGVQLTIAHENDNPTPNNLHIKQLIDTPLNSEYKISALRVELAAGYKEPSHTHPGEEILYIIEGQGKLWKNGQSQHIQTGDVILVSRGTLKALDNSTNHKPLKVLAYLAIENNQPALTIHEPNNLKTPSDP